MATTAIPAGKPFLQPSGCPYLPVLKFLAASEAGLPVNNHPFSALELSLATSLWYSLFQQVWEWRDSVKIFWSVHSTAGKLGRRKKDRVYTLASKEIPDIFQRPIFAGIKALVKAETKQLLFPRKQIALVPWSFCFIKASFYKVPLFPCHKVDSKVPLGILPWTTQDFGVHPEWPAWDHPASL